MTLTDRKYDVVIFGATGFTGKHVILEVVKTLEAASINDKFTWAVAGRTESKLDAILQEISEESGKNLKDVDKIIADVSNPESLRAMAKQCTVVLNCVGPYILWGEVVVKACVEEGTSHLDISGEPQFLEKMQISYNESAEDSGSYIIGACGFDSIPADYGAIYMENNFDGQLNSVESYLKIHKGKTKTKINYGTWHSLVIVCHRAFELISLKRQLFPEPYFKFQYKLHNMPIHYSEDAQGWCFNLPAPDMRVMERSQRYKWYHENRRPAQTRAYLRNSNMFLAILMFVGSICLAIFAQFKCGFYLLKNYPRLFSFGMITRKGPTKEEMVNDVTFIVVGKGWDKSVSKTDDKYLTPPNKKVVLKVQCHNPGYGATSTMMLQAGLSIIKERNLMPSKGGVYTPGIAFARTTLAERLTQHGVKFTLEK